jgi:hypothetical protein
MCTRDVPESLSWCDAQQLRDKIARCAVTMQRRVGSVAVVVVVRVAVVAVVIRPLDAMIENVCKHQRYRA